MAAPIFGQPLKTVEKGARGATKAGTNPMLVHGPGPEGATCKTCLHLAVNRCSRSYWKCRFRKVSASAATDHRQMWPACVHYREEAEQSGATDKRTG